MYGESADITVSHPLYIYIMYICICVCMYIYIYIICTVEKSATQIAKWVQCNHLVN